MCIFVIYIEFFPYCLFVSNSQVIGCEDRLSEVTYTVSGRALNSTQSNQSNRVLSFHRANVVDYFILF